MPKSRPTIADTPAEFMQLSLFSEVPDSPPIDSLKEESTNASDGRPDTARTSDSGALEQVSTEDGRIVDGAGSAIAGDLRSAGTDEQPPLRTGSGPEDGLPDRLGTGDERVGVSSGRGGSAPVVVRSGGSRRQTTLARDFRITDADEVGHGSLREKAQANLAAIRTLKRIEGEDRPAEPAEKAILIKYA